MVEMKLKKKKPYRKEALEHNKEWFLCFLEERNNSNNGTIMLQEIKNKNIPNYHISLNGKEK